MSRQRSSKTTTLNNLVAKHNKHRGGAHKERKAKRRPCRVKDGSVRFGEDD